MNILIPHNWLKEHLETDVTPEKLQKLVSLSGPSIERIYDIDGESVYDIEVTTNRVDSMSIRGIAREAAVILAQAGERAKLKELQLPEISLNGEPLSLPKVVNNDMVCKRVMCVILDSVEHTPTPDWMAKRLKQIDQNIHDSVIDITNYITHELGHPCHAFDYDKIMALGGEIKVVEAQEGQLFTTLDGEEYTTVGGEVVFENPKGEIIDLPAIKGTANTAVDNSTKRVLLWIESIQAEKVRFGSMTHAIRTVAAQLNEKNVDPNLADDVLCLGVKLYQELCHARVASEVFDYYPTKYQPAKVSINQKKIDTYLGLAIDSKTIIKILQDLGCKVTFDEQSKEYTVLPPTFRPDIAIPVDIVEEIARIYGYHTLPSTLMDTAIPLAKPENTNFAVENEIKHFLSAIGWQEIYSYSLVSESVAQNSGIKAENHLKLANPLTDDKVYLRQTVIPSLEEIIQENSERNSMSVFEFANRYVPQENELPIETYLLTLVTTSDYRSLRGTVESVLNHYFIEKVTIIPTDEAVPGFHQAGEIVVTASHTGQEVSIGYMGISQAGLVACEIVVAKLLQCISSHPQYQPLPKTAIITEDITFTIENSVAIGQVIESINQINEYVQTVTLKDIYKNNYTFGISYHNPEENLSSADIEPLRKDLVNMIAKKYNGSLVGQI